jgi:hypothetical protein
MIGFLADAAATIVAAVFVLGVLVGLPAYYVAKALHKARKYK